MLRSKHPFHETVRLVRGSLFYTLLFSLFINILLLASPLYMLQVYDRVLTSRSLDTLYLLTLVVVIALLTMAILEAVRSGIAARAGLWLDHKLSQLLLPSTVHFSLKSGSEMASQGLRDMGNVRNFLTGHAVFSLMDAPWVPVYLAVLFLLHPVLGWISVGGAVMIFSVALLNQYATRKSLQQSSALSARAYGFADSVGRNADVVEAMGMTPQLVERWEGLNGEALKQQQGALGVTGMLSSLSRFLRLSLQVAILGMGAVLTIEGEITAGVIIAASILFGRALQPVEQSLNSWRSATSAWDAYQRVKKQLLATPSYADNMELPQPKGEVAMEGLSYGFPGSGQAFIKGVSFRLEPGKVLAMLGPSGSGKTTLVRLLLGNLAPSSGHARFDGMEVSRWHAADRGQHIGYLPQDVELFSGSVKDNIARMSEGHSEQIIEAAQLANVHEMIMRLPKGYDTQIGAHGMSLSGGQRQRIGLARALYGDPRLVVLDEPNASLDQPGEAALLEALKNIKQKQMTVVIISHRPNILEHADFVLIMQEGMMVKYGPRDEVLQRQPRPEIAKPHHPSSATPRPSSISYTVGK